MKYLKVLKTNGIYQSLMKNFSFRYGSRLTELCCQEKQISAFSAFFFLKIVVAALQPSKNWCVLGTLKLGFREVLRPAALARKTWLTFRSGSSHTKIRRRTVLDTKKTSQSFNRKCCSTVKPRKSRVLSYNTQTAQTQHEPTQTESKLRFDPN